MAEPLKLMFDEKKISQLANELAKASVKFDKKNFISSFNSDEWAKAELKQRVSFIAEAIHRHLHLDYPSAIKVLIPVSAKFSWGFFGVFFCEYVEKYGQDFWDESMHALGEFTKSSTAEFAIRKFIRLDPVRAMKQMEIWSKSDNHHVRRLSSEGCRPRLPWGVRLDEFVKDPGPVLSILRRLRNDPELYVRKSVANNLNDISRDHPELVLSLAEEWIGHTSETDWIIRHSLRTLLKKGNKRALSLFDHHDAEGLSVHGHEVTPKSIRIGGSLELSFSLKNERHEPVPVRIEYAVDYMKANGKHNSKVFRISSGTARPGDTGYKRKIKFADLTTRKHYPGNHRMHILINGEVKSSCDFVLNSQH